MDKLTAFSSSDESELSTILLLFFWGFWSSSNSDELFPGLLSSFDSVEFPELHFSFLFFFFVVTKSESLSLLFPPDELELSPFLLTESSSEESENLCFFFKSRSLSESESSTMELFFDFL